MKSGYRVINSVSNGATAIEVINNEKENHIMNLGWIYLRTAYYTKDKSTVGVWKLKQLKN